MKKAFLQLHIAVFLAGFTAILGKLIHLHEGLLVWYRLFFSIFIIGGILISKNEFKKISINSFIPIASVGLILAFHWVAFYGSVKYSTASVAVVCLSAAGFFSSLLETLTLKQPLILSEVALGLLSMLGIYIIFDFHPQYKLGIIFGMLSSLGSALFPVFNKRLLLKYSPRVLTFYEFTGGLLFLTLLLPVYLIYFPSTYVLPTTSDFFWLIILTVFCTVIAFDFQLNALRNISAFTSNLTYNLEPLYGIGMAFLFFNENKLLNPHFYLGLMFILLAIVLQMIRVIRQKKSAI